jgi:hypothetical protein
MSTRCSPAELRALELSDGLGPYIGSKAGQARMLGPGLDRESGRQHLVHFADQFAKMDPGLDNTLAFFGASESEFSATAAKPVMNMILMSGIRSPFFLAHLALEAYSDRSSHETCVAHRSLVLQASAVRPAEAFLARAWLLDNFLERLRYAHHPNRG